MGLKLDVKINQVSSLSEARYAAGMGVKWLGFAFEGPKAQNVSEFQGMMGWLSGVEPVIEVEHLDETKLFELQNVWQVPCIQFKSVAPLLSKPNGMVWIQSLSANSLDDVEKALTATSYIDYILVDGISISNWEDEPDRIKAVHQHSKIIWQLPFNETNITRSLTEIYGIEAIALNAGQEERPGWQDLDDIMIILEAIEE